MSAEPYTGPVTLFTTYAEPELRGQDGELIATFMPHRLDEARRLAACWNACEDVPTANLNAKHITRIAFDIVRDTTVKLQAERDALLRVVQAYEAARESLFVQCCSNPITNAWGKEVSVAKLNEAHQMAGQVLRTLGAEQPTPPRPRRPPAPPPEHCDGQQSKCRWVPDGAGSKCLTCGDAIPF